MEIKPLLVVVLLIQLKIALYKVLKQKNKRAVPPFVSVITDDSAILDVYLI